MVHFAPSLDVVVEFHDAGFVGEERGAEFVQAPSEIVTVIIKRIVSVLAGVEAAIVLIRQYFIHPADDAFGSLAQKWVLRDLPPMEIVFQEFGIVVRHFLEVRDEPALIDGVAMKAAG